MNPAKVLEFLLVRLAAVAVRRVPLPLAQRFAAFAAGRTFDREGRQVRYALANLRIAFPDIAEGQRREIGRQSYVHLAWNLIDLARSGRWSAEEIQKHIRIEGGEHLERALAQGRGVVLLAPHLGNFELAAAALPLLGFRSAWVARPMKNELIYRWVSQRRTRTGGVLIDRRHAAIKILRVLRRGEVVGVMNDQYSRRSRGVFVPFFGVRCSTTAGVAALALRTGALVLPTYVVRDGPDHHTLTIEAPLPAESDGERKVHIEAATDISTKTPNSFGAQT